MPIPTKSNRCSAIVVYGDSLSLPRAHDGIRCADTYPELLRETLPGIAPKAHPAVLNRSLGGAAIATLYAQFIRDSIYVGLEAGHVLVIQCGIVDCAPRPVPPRVKSSIGRLPVPLRWAIAKLLHYSRPMLLRWGLSWRNTPAQEFSRILEVWIARAEKAARRIYVINIAPPSAAMDRHSPGVAASVRDYNALIAEAVGRFRPETVRLVDVYREIARSPHGEDIYLSPADGHHITCRGHRLYADLIAAAESESAEALR